MSNISQVIDAVDQYREAIIVVAILVLVWVLARRVMKAAFGK